MSVLFPARAVQCLCSRKALGWDLGAEQQAGGTVNYWGTAQGLCYSLGNDTQARSLMNSASLHKSCWKVPNVPAGQEPAAAVCWRTRCSAGELAQPPGSSQGRLIICLLEGKPRGDLFFPLSLGLTWTLAPWCWFFLGHLFAKKCNRGGRNLASWGVLGFCRCQRCSRSSTAVAASTK